MRISERKKQRNNFERRDHLAKRFSANVNQQKKKIAKVFFECEDGTQRVELWSRSG